MPNKTNSQTPELILNNRKTPNYRMTDTQALEAWIEETGINETEIGREIGRSSTCINQWRQQGRMPIDAHKAVLYTRMEEDGILEAASQETVMVKGQPDAIESFIKLAAYANLTIEITKL